MKTNIFITSCVIALHASTAQAGLLDRLFGNSEENVSTEENNVAPEGNNVASEPKEVVTAVKKNSSPQFTYDQIKDLSSVDRKFQLIESMWMDRREEETWAYDALVSASDQIDYDLLFDKAPNKSVVTNAEQVKALLEARKFKVDGYQYDFNMDAKLDIALWLESPFPEFKFANTNKVNSRPMFLMQNLGNDQYKLVLQTHAETLEFYHPTQGIRFNPLLDNSKIHPPYMATTYAPADMSKYILTEELAKLHKARKKDETLTEELACFYYVQLKKGNGTASMLDNYYKSLFEILEDNGEKLSDPDETPRDVSMTEIGEIMDKKYSYSELHGHARNAESKAKQQFIDRNGGDKRYFYELRDVYVEVKN